LNYFITLRTSLTQDIPLTS